MYEEIPTDQNYHLDDLEIEEQTTTRDGQPSRDHAEDVTRRTGFFVGDLEVSFVKQNNEVDCTQGNNSLGPWRHEPYIHDTQNVNLEEQPRMTLQDNEQF